jgi:hypothetical protein
MTHAFQAFHDVECATVTHPNPEELREMAREKGPTTPTTRKRAPRKSVGTGKATLTMARFVDLERRAALIAEAAFFRAEKRGFAPGNEVQDWLAAEAEVDAKLLNAAESGPRDQQRPA